MGVQLNPLPVPRQHEIIYSQEDQNNLVSRRPNSFNFMGYLRKVR